MARSSRLVPISTSGAVCLGYKNGSFQLLGGHRLPHESNRQCVMRETREEVKGLRLRDVTLWKIFNGKRRKLKHAPRPKTKKMSDAIFVARGSGFVEIRDGELDGVGWFRKWKKLRLTTTTRLVLTALVVSGYLNG